MSIRRLPRELGIILRCNHEGCTAKQQTALVRADYNRSWAAKSGWGRGLTKGRKRMDLCPTHMPIERELLAKQKAEREAEKSRRDELKKAKFSGAPKPKKPRAKRTTPATSSSPVGSSPRADSAPAAAT